jgi:hypothetical protein
MNERLSASEWKQLCLIVGWLVILFSGIVTIHRRREIQNSLEARFLLRISGLLLGIAFLICSR